LNNAIGGIEGDGKNTAGNVDLEADEARRIANIRKYRSKGKKKNHMHRNGDQLAMNKEEDLVENKLCKLCNRENPLYFYQ